MARQRADRAGLGDDTPDLLAGLAGTALWLVRLLLAGPSTLQGFRAWAVAECPVAPGRKAAPAAALPAAAAMPALTRRPARNPQKPRHDGRPTKRDLLIRLAREQRDLATVPLGEVSRLATALAHEIGYSPGTARRELIRHVRDLQSGSAETTPAVRKENGHG